MIQELGIFIFSHAGALLGLKLKRDLVRRFAKTDAIALTGPKQLLARHPELKGIEPYTDMHEAVGRFWLTGGALLFIGAAGIAVRAVAPLLEHKSTDAPVLVLDAAGQYCICLLAGHWGGGNALAREISFAVGAVPVLTTASEFLGGKLSLDLLLKETGAKILDWNELAGLQGRILEGKKVPVWDPAHVLPEHDILHRISQRDLHPTVENPAIAVHWKSLPETPGLLRVAPPLLHVGIGFRKLVRFSELLAGFNMALSGMETQAVTALATVTVKAEDEAFVSLAEKLHVKTEAYTAEELALIPTPHPSRWAAERFGTAPFSVCEAAAMASAAQHGRPCLLRPKIKVQRSMTFAVATALGGSHE